MMPLLGKYTLSSLDKSTYVGEYYNVLKKKYSDRTVALFHRLFKIAINTAVEDEIIPRNHFQKITIEINGDLENVLTAAELDLFLQVTKKYENITNYTLILVLAFTGLRRGEALGLRWRHVNFNEKTVTVECTRDQYGCRTPKTKNSYRKIPVDQMLINQLLSYQRWCVETKFSYGMKVDKENDFVFISYQDGAPIAENMAFYSFKRILKILKMIKRKHRSFS
ncbi:tyrosine-type recombinase/integrase [Paenibacillus qinlingensis]|uniref:tyrosine-type recombinase/integrase n=1 Tax=Paenibacillus qinlingensis TaxID=1837343 RepID=UPI0015656260|nr:site-specific integrase [Paenibacillus qinlingensis]NQX57544.1 site-specific integrase [Paenibacillus qinlingensis]